MKYVSKYIYDGKNMPTIQIPFGKGSNSDETRNELQDGEISILKLVTIAML